MIPGFSSSRRTPRGPLSVAGVAVSPELVTQIRLQDKWWNSRGFSHQGAHESNRTPVICPSRRTNGTASVDACLLAAEWSYAVMMGTQTKLQGGDDCKVTGAILYVPQRNNLSLRTENQPWSWIFLGVYFISVVFYPQKQLIYKNKTKCSRNKSKQENPFLWKPMLSEHDRVQYFHCYSFISFLHKAVLVSNWPFRAPEESSWWYCGAIKSPRCLAFFFFILSMSGLSSPIYLLCAVKSPRRKLSGPPRSS